MNRAEEQMGNLPLKKENIMPIMEWHENFETGIGQFDEHHKHFVCLINKICDDMDDGRNHDTLRVTFDELIDYASYHFAAEENWMEVHKFPGLELHKAEHDRFCGEVVEIQKDFHNGKLCLSLELLQFLIEWLTNHILNTDAEYGRFAKELPDNE
jgi:hemerythrin